MKVVFVTLYDEGARGLRSVAASVQAAGHQVAFIHCKAFRSVTIPCRDVEALKWALAQSPYQVREIVPDGERFHPYLTPTTAVELRLFAGLLDQLKPDVIGLSFGTPAFPRALELTRVVRETCPRVPLLWGGVHAIVAPEECLAHADVVCVGEGEEAVVEYLADPRRTDVAGLWFRSPGGTIKNPFRPLIQNLDALPWPLYGADEYQLGGNKVGRLMAESPGYIALNYYTETTRGCPFACTYCIHSTCRDRYPGQKYVRVRSLENVIAEIRAFRQRFGLQAILPFFDEILLINKPRFARFARLYKAEIGHPFCGFAHHRTTDREMLELARDAGIAETSIGVQTGSVRLAQEIYHRPIDREAIVRLAREIHEVGAGRLILNVLADCAFEQEPDLRDTFELLLQMPRPYLLQLSRVVPFPNTLLARMTPDRPPLPQPVREFWSQMYLLTQTDLLDEPALRALAEDHYLRAHPDVLRDRVRAILHGDSAGGPALSELGALQPVAPPPAPRPEEGLLRRAFRKIGRCFGRSA